MLPGNQPRPDWDDVRVGRHDPGPEGQAGTAPLPDYSEPITGSPPAPSWRPSGTRCGRIPQPGPPAPPTRTPEDPDRHRPRQAPESFRGLVRGNSEARATLARAERSMRGGGMQAKGIPRPGVPGSRGICDDCGGVFGDVEQLKATPCVGKAPESSAGNRDPGVSIIRECWELVLPTTGHHRRTETGVCRNFTTGAPGTRRAPESRNRSIRN